METRPGAPVLEPEVREDEEIDKERFLLSPEKYGQPLFDLVRKCLLDRTSVENFLSYEEPFESENALFTSMEYLKVPSELQANLLRDIITICNARLLRWRSTHKEYFRDGKMRNYSGGYDKPDYNEFEFTSDNENYYRQESHETFIESSIAQLGDCGTRGDIDFLLDFWDKNRDPAYGPAIAETVSKIDADSGVSLILDKLPQAAEPDRRRLLSLLYRLELGRVGISEEGLNYLGRRFDLGEYNNSANFAQRITADGKVGVFGADRTLEGFVQLEANDFSGTDNQARQKEVLGITYEMLFTPRPDETPEERATRENILENFKAKYFDTYLGLFAEGEQKHGLHFNNLTLPEQGFVLQFLTENRGNRVLRDRFFQFLSEYGENGFFAFRSSEFDPSAAERILNLDKTAAPEHVEWLFSEYRRTYELAARAANHIMQMLQGQENALEVNLIRENILMMAEQILTGDDMDGMALLYLMNLNGQLTEILNLPPTIEGFIEGQMYLAEFLADNMPKQSQAPDYLTPAIIAKHLQRLYDNPEFNLRDFEGKTTDTSVSLRYLLDLLGDDRLRATADRPDELKIYDVGAGDGRMAIPLSKAGCRVVGIDISPRMVNQASERIRQEQGDPAKINIQEGNFFEFDSDKFDQVFGPEKADVAIIMWHTFGFAGNRQGQLQVLKNVFDNLRPGGKIIIELPDRNFGGYARALRDYHQAHPETPFGTLVDAPSAGASPSEQNQTTSSPRSFPSNEEMQDLLAEAGFDLPFYYDYFVRGQNKTNQSLVIKENLFVAQKPFNQERLARWRARMVGGPEAEPLEVT